MSDEGRGGSCREGTESSPVEVTGNAKLPVEKSTVDLRKGTKLRVPGPWRDKYGHTELGRRGEQDQTA